MFWALVAYLVLPRLHRILTTIYVPDYFIGRARTSDGLLGDPINLAFMGDEAQVDHLLLFFGPFYSHVCFSSSSFAIIFSITISFGSFSSFRYSYPSICSSNPQILPVHPPASTITVRDSPT